MAESSTVSAAARKRAGSRVSAKRRIARGHRHHRLRKKVSGTAQRPRLAVHRSSRHMFVQLIDDVAGTTLAAASTEDASIKGSGTGNVEAAKKVGALVADRAKGAGVSKVVFDRGGFLYHGRVAALADAARAEGLEF